MRQPPPTPTADGLLTPEVGSWAEDKYNIVWLYDSLFSSGMKNKWDTRVYVDLYSGAGQVQVRGTSRLLYGSPLLALQVRDPFDKYVFCEEDPARFSALTTRARRIAPTADISFIEGNCDTHVSQILAGIPAASRDRTVLTFCFVDPFGIGIDFSTIRSLASRFTDFLVLLALHMDANRNYENYVKEESTKIDQFLGNIAWRDEWKEAQLSGLGFPNFLAGAFSKSMQGLNYLPPPQRKSVRSDDKNLRLYDLALFSKSQRAYDFWEQVLKYHTDQIGLF